MIQQYQRSDEIHITLRRTVLSAALFFATADERLTDGCQTAHEVLAHLVFWHREYVAIAQALAGARQPELRSGTLVELNACACQEFAGMPLPALAHCLVTLQELLEAAVRHLPDWEINFPVKQGGRYWSIDERLPMIESHVRRHVAQLRHATRRRSPTNELIAREVQV
jgi:hypothetical protein